MTKSFPISDPTPQDIVIVAAPAKINPILRILDRRPDGYHNLWSVMQTVGLEDEVQMRLLPERHDIRLHCDTEQLASDHTNLVYRAASAAIGRSRRSTGLEIKLSKRIPMGAGLGGGSSDAAATLLGLNRLLNMHWSREEMAAVGEPLGSDVPFFLFGPSAIVSGRGERVRPVNIEGPRWVVLVNPGFGIETKWAYAQLAASRSSVNPAWWHPPRPYDAEHVTWDQLAQDSENDFEGPVYAKYGILKEFTQALRDRGAEMALLSGSGATVFGIFRHEVAAKLARTHFDGLKNVQTFVVQTCSGPRIVP